MTGKPSLKCLIAFLLLLISCSYSFAQERVVSGQVKDPQGNPLPGVSVSVWGTRQSVTADVTGSFSIPVRSEDAVLVFSFVGFLQKEVKVGKETTLSITMAYDNADLDQVVVVGYGTSKRRDLTGSIYSVKPGMVTAAPSSNALESLQGRVPGLDITKSSGSAGAGVNVLVRGTRTIGLQTRATSSNPGPLYIIDGFQGGNIADLNPNDIESVEVLKDASATAIYGWMGASGVIIVTTKRGKERPKVSYSGYYGINGYASYPKGRTGDDYVKLRKEAWRNGGGAVTNDDVLFTGIAGNGEQQAFDSAQWVDWVDLLLRNGIEQSHTASIQSGGDKTKVFFSTGYYNEQGTLRGNDMTRYNSRLNYDQRISNTFKAGFQSQVAYTNLNSRGTDPLSKALATVPLGKAYDSLGNITQTPLQNNSTANVLLDERPGAYKNNTAKYNVIANAYIEITPITGLSIRSNFGSNLTFSRQGIYKDSISYSNFRQKNSTQSETQFNRFYNWDNIVTYSRKIADHGITLTGITSYTRYDAEDQLEQGFRQLLPYQLWYDMQATEASSRYLYSTYSRTTSMSYAGRLNYAFKGKYLFTASLRGDGVSVLSAGHKWDYFPSAALGWNIHQENFMSGLTFVNNLKLRASYGVAGNANLKAYATQLLVFVPSSGGQNFGDITAPMYNYGDGAILGNPDLGWEKTATKNLGLDFAFFKSHIYGTIDAYKSKTKDVLLSRSVPWSTGFQYVYENVGETENKGIEAVVSSINVNNRDFKWTSTVTFTAANEKITKLINGQDMIDKETNSLLIGHPVSSFYTYKKLGIWQNDESKEAAALKFGNTPFVPGDIKLADLNHDGVIDPGPDRTYIGSTVPKWFAGLQNSWSYKGLELSVYLFARWGQTINAKFMGRYNPNGLGNGPRDFNYWTPENATNDFPRPKYNASIDKITGYQTLNFIDGSYLKIKTVTLAYTLPQQITRKVYTDRVRLYITGNNIFTKAKNKLLTNYDPERGGDESNPLSRQIVFGLNADF